MNLDSIDPDFISTLNTFVSCLKNDSTFLPPSILEHPVAKKIDELGAPKEVRLFLIMSHVPRALWREQSEENEQIDLYIREAEERYEEIDADSVSYTKNIEDVPDELLERADDVVSMEYDTDTIGFYVRERNLYTAHMMQDILQSLGHNIPERIRKYIDEDNKSSRTERK